MTGSRKRPKGGRPRAPAVPLYRSARTSIELPAGFLTTPSGSLRVPRVTLRSVLEQLAGEARAIIRASDDGQHVEQARELLRAVSVAIASQGEAQALAVFEVGRAAERCNVQGSLGPELGEKVERDQRTKVKATTAGKASADARRASTALMHEQIKRAAAKARAAGVSPRRVASTVAERLRGRVTPKTVRKVLRAPKRT